MTPLDFVLAVVGATGHVARRAVRGSRAGLGAVIAVLFLASLIPTLAIGTSPRPTDLTFEDIRTQRIPALTTWVRLEGTLEVVETVTGPVYHLKTAGDTQHYVTVTAAEPLQPGPQVLTGQLGLGTQGSDVIGFLEADIPPEPRRDEPFQVILLPAALAIVILLGLRLGYPVIRKDRSRGPDPDARPLVEQAKVSGAWSGRIGNVEVPHADAVPCTIRLSPDPELPDMADLVITERETERRLRVRRTARSRPVRLCRVSGSKPGLEFHTHTADCVLSFADGEVRAALMAGFIA